MGEDAFSTESEAALPVSDPDAQLAVLQVPQHQRPALLDANRRKAGLEARREVAVEEHSVLWLRRTVGCRGRGIEPSEQRHQLAAVADAQRESVAAISKSFELRPQRSVAPSVVSGNSQCVNFLGSVPEI